MAAPHPLLLPLLTAGDLPSDVEIDMDVVDSAEEHWVAPLVDVAVIDRVLPVTRDAAVRLAARSLATRAEVTACTTTAGKVIKTADGLGIEIAIFKGLAISARFYADSATRASVDVDVFVAPRDTCRLGDLAVALGADVEDRVAIDAMVAEGRVFETSVTVGDVPVDLHVDPMNMMTPSHDVDARWGRTVPFELPDGTVARTLDLEDTLIQALLHLFRDNFADLLHINDMRLLLDAEPDWDVVALRSEQEGVTDIIRFALWFVCDTLDRPSPLPARITRWRKLLIDRIWPRSLLLKGHTSHAHSLRRQSALSLISDDGVVTLGRVYARRIFPPRSVIEYRSESSSRPYPLALASWRLGQHRQGKAFRRDGGGST